MTISPNQPESDTGGESRLRQRIADEIRRDGPMPFSRYMQMCLYEPELGYYSHSREQFGRAGDFYTSSDVHAVFGRLLARQFEEMWRALDSPQRIDVIELGPGRGLFARDVLDWSAKHFPEFSGALRYALVEQSAHLRARLQERLAEHVAVERARVFDSLEAAASTAGENIIVFGNEFFDALPVEVVDYRGGLRIGLENGKFVETFVPPAKAEVEFLDRYGVHPEEGERVEATLVSLEWMERIAEAFRRKRGFLVAIDYGYTREEQLAGRHRDTIMSYRQHTASTSPYEAPGEQDITAHVNFTAIRARGLQRGLDPVALLTQSQFLIGIGEETRFADAFQDCKLPQERAKVALQLKHLISPTGMGETFQVLLMSAGVTKEEAAGLSGLKLGQFRG
ncbi:MAG: SAM-dependent methyltransferase [Candidatus Korobacteraceae bacterium]